MRTAVVVGTCLVSLSLFAACRSESTGPAATSNPVSSLTPVARVELAASGPSDGVPGDYWSVGLSLYDATGSELLNRQVTWALSDPAVAIIRATLWNQASVQGQRAGIVTITATVEGRSASARIVVLPLPSTQAMLWSPSSGVTLIGVLPGAASSVATAINDAGQVVGYSDIAGRSHAFLWSEIGRAHV